MTDLSSDQVFDAIEAIAKTSSKNEKEALVKQYLAFPLFKRICVAAYDPYVTYGIAKVPERELGKFAPGETLFIGPVWTMLENLAARKLTGNAAREEVHRWMQLLTSKSAELLKRIIKKDLRAGFTDGTINRVARGTIREFPYMRCTLVKDVKFDTWPWGEGCISQEKADGMFANVDHEAGGVVNITSRQGTPFPMDLLEELASAVRFTLKANTQTHGELVVMVDGKIAAREIGNGILNALSQGRSLEANQKVLFLTWDQIPLGEVRPKGQYKTGYRFRIAELARQIANGTKANPNSPIKLIPTRIVKSVAEAYKHYAELLAQGKEGTIVKHPAAIWKDGTSREQVKLKLEVDVDLRVIGFVPGTGKNEATFGSIKCATSCGELEVDVSGFTDAQRKEIIGDWKSYIDRIMVVKANSIMVPRELGKKHSLFLPRFVEFRTDKTEADSLERVKNQFDSAVRS
jgi:DNA ligase-1